MTDDGRKNRSKLSGKNGDCFDLRLFVADDEPKCVLAYHNLKEICRKSLRGKYRITIIDLAKNPEIARQEQITAIPTLVRVPLAPGRVKVVGTLSDSKKVLAGLGVPLRKNGPATAGG